MTLTTEKIHEAADAVAKRGDRPTLATVRSELGGGSFTTIGEAMKTWRQAQQAEQALQKIEYPNAIDDRLRSLGASVWQLAMEMADGRLKAEREAIIVAHDEAQSQITDAQEAVKVLENERAELLKELDTLSHSVDVAIADAKNNQSKYETLKIEHNDLKVEHARTDGKLTVRDEQVKTIIAERDGLNSTNKELMSRISQLESGNQRL